jgi:rubrerythrin
MMGKVRITKRREELSKIFKMALAQEKSAQNLYQRAIAHCDDEDWRSLLAGLRADEARHEQELLELQKELTAFLELQEAASSGTRKKAATKRAAGSRKKP